MAQHDYVIANASGATVRADINSMALAISSNNSGSSAPSTTYAYEFWIDTTNNLLKLRNAANNAWLTMPFSITADNTVDINGGTIDGTNVGASSAGTGAFTTLAASSATDLNSTLAVSGNVSLDGSANELRFYEGSNYVGFEAPALTGDQIWVLPTADGSASQVLTTNGSGTLSWATAASGPTFKTFATSSIMIGDDATGTINAANYNTGVGVDIFAALTEGDGNTVFGFSAGKTLNTGQRNVIMGYNAMDAANTGSDSVMIGYEAGGAVVDAIENVAVGYYAGAADMGNYNSFVGASAGQAVTGEKNTFLGARAGIATNSGNGNVAIGYNALAANTSGERHVAIGDEALAAVTGGNHDAIAIGRNALHDHTTPGDCIAIGKYAFDGSNSASSTQCIAIGSHCLGGALAGYGNVGIGYYVMDVATSAIHNTGVGRDTLGALTTGDNNACYGAYAGDGIATGSNNICLGYGADVNDSAAANQICIGTSVTASGDNYVTIGKASPNFIYNGFTSNATWTRASDERLKKDINTNEEIGLDFINDLRTVNFKWKAPSEIDEGVSGHNSNIHEHDHTDKLYGFIAQEVKAVLDEKGITDFNGWHTNKSNDIQGISYEMFVVPLVKAIQELSLEVDELKKKLN